MIVHTRCILSVGTVPTDNLSLTFKLCFIPFLDWWMVEEYSGDGMKLWTPYNTPILLIYSHHVKLRHKSSVIHTRGEQRGKCNWEGTDISNKTKITSNLSKLYQCWEKQSNLSGLLNRLIGIKNYKLGLSRANISFLELGLASVVWTMDSIFCLHIRFSQKIVGQNGRSIIFLAQQNFGSNNV